MTVEATIRQHYPYQKPSLVTMITATITVEVDAHRLKKDIYTW